MSSGVSEDKVEAEGVKGEVSLCISFILPSVIEDIIINPQIVNKVIVNPPKINHFILLLKSWNVSQSMYFVPSFGCRIISAEKKQMKGHLVVSFFFSRGFLSIDPLRKRDLWNCI